MMPDLPADLVEEILTRVPATSLKWLRSTCKGWNTLFENGRFREKHFFGKAAKQSAVVMLKDFRVCSISVNLNDVRAPSIEFKSAFGLKDFEQVDISEVCHYDSLLLCRTKDNRLVVCNPCLGETRWIQFGHRSSSSRFALGYQNNKSGHSYKILRYWDCFKASNHFVRFEIYEFSSGSWRALDHLTHSCWIKPNSVSLKGNTYWLAFDDTNYFILSFDFTRERLRRHCLPPSGEVNCIALSVVREEQLSVLHRGLHRRSKMELDIWVASKIETETEATLLWSLSFTVDLDYSFSGYPVFVTYLIDEEKKVVICCNERFRDSGNMLYVIGQDDECLT